MSLFNVNEFIDGLAFDERVALSHFRAGTPVAKSGYTYVKVADEYLIIRDDGRWQLVRVPGKGV